MHTCCATIVISVSILPSLTVGFPICTIGVVVSVSQQSPVSDCANTYFTVSREELLLCSASISQSITNHLSRKNVYLSLEMLVQATFRE